MKIHRVVWTRDLSEETAKTDLEHEVEGEEMREEGRAAPRSKTRGYQSLGVGAQD